MRIGINSLLKCWSGRILKRLFLMRKRMFLWNFVSEVFLVFGFVCFLEVWVGVGGKWFFGLGRFRVVFF